MNVQYDTRTVDLFLKMLILQKAGHTFPKSEIHAIVCRLKHERNINVPYTFVLKTTWKSTFRRSRAEEDNLVQVPYSRELERDLDSLLSKGMIVHHPSSEGVAEMDCRQYTVTDTFLANWERVYAAYDDLSQRPISKTELNNAVWEMSWEDLKSFLSAAHRSYLQQYFNEVA